MRGSNMGKDEDKKYEYTGKAVFSIAYLIFSLKCIAVFSLIALAVLLVLHKQLWYAPLFGAAAFLVYRFFRRLFFRLMIRFARWADQDNTK